ncbi:hypothetical protein ACXYMT_11710 [Salinimicrobium sp. CAU 1759]
MKRYEIYRNIRQRALIYGLPIAFFALMMLSVIGSLLGIIFSFSVAVITGAVVINIGLYIALIKITQHPQLLNFRKVFPEMLSSKKSSGLYYEN